MLKKSDNGKLLAEAGLVYSDIDIYWYIEKCYYTKNNIENLIIINILNIIFCNINKEKKFKEIILI